MNQLTEKYILQNSSTESKFIRAKSRANGKEIAIKKISFMNMTEKDKRSVIEEVNLLMNVKSNHIIRYECFVVDKRESCLYVAMEYCSGQNLQDYLNLNKANNTYLEEKNIWKIFTEVVEAVGSIHNDPKGALLHRNIKPCNIILENENNVKLGNFGLLRRLDPEEEFAMTVIKESYYQSPEQITNGIYSTKSDIWALGCLLFEMATLRPPFRKSSEFETAHNIKTQKVENIPSHYSEELKRVINWCLSKEREERPTAAMLRGVPEISIRIRKSRNAENRRILLEKEEKLLKREETVRILEEKMKMLENMNHLEEEKENNRMDNIYQNSKALIQKNIF